MKGILALIDVPGRQALIGFLRGSGDGTSQNRKLHVVQMVDIRHDRKKYPHCTHTKIETPPPQSHSQVVAELEF